MNAKEVGQHLSGFALGATSTLRSQLPPKDSLSNVARAASTMFSVQLSQWILCAPMPSRQSKPKMETSPLPADLLTTFT